jgi:hypothetical protein
LLTREAGAAAIWEAAIRDSSFDDWELGHDRPKTRARKSVEATVKKPTKYGQSSSPEPAMERKSKGRTAVKISTAEIPKESSNVDLLPRPRPKPVQCVILASTFWR